MSKLNVKKYTKLQFVDDGKGMVERMNIIAKELESENLHVSRGALGSVIVTLSNGDIVQYIPEGDQIGKYECEREGGNGKNDKSK